jgi:ADP-heptose:LPS heptosyltransferase
MAEAFPGYDHMLLYGYTPSEEAEADGVMEKAGKRENILPEKGADLERSAMLLRHATMVVGNNSGIRNLAIANETPTLGVFVSGSHFNYWPRFGLHDVVFEMEGGAPSVERVFRTAADHLKRIEKEDSR